MTVADGSLLDYETSASHDITVRVTDSGGNTYDEVMTLNLTDVNETPTDLSLTNVEIAEGAANGTVVGTAAASDADAGETFSYSLTNDAGGRFAIDVNTGVITVADGSLLDYETAAAHDVTVRVTDSGGLTYDESYTIGVNDERESPDTLHAEITGHDPVMYLRLDATADGVTTGYGDTAADQTGNHNGTYNGGSDPAAGAFSDISTGATDFDGDEYISVPDSPDFDLANGSVQVWFNADDITGSQALVSRDASGQNESGHMKIWLDGDDLMARIQDGLGNTYTLSAADVVSQDVWHQVTFSFGADGAKLYLDGNLVDSDAYTGGIDGNNNPWAIGVSTSSSTDGNLDNLGGHFDGQMAEFALYDTQLSADDISDIYGAGASGSDVQSWNTAALVDLIEGTAGDDTLTGANSDDFLYGGDGDDTFIHDAGEDVISGGSGTDTVDASSATNTITADLEAGTLTNNSGAVDTLSGIENVIGGTGGDIFRGNDAANVFTGGDGSDTFRVGDQAGNDIIHGGTGGGWTDTIQLMNANNSSVAGGWTVQLDTGSVQSDDGSTMTLTDDAAGTITLSDGSEIAFDGLERIEY